MDIWSWICELPDSQQWPTTTLSEQSSNTNNNNTSSTLVLPLATSKPTTTNISNSIQLRAEKSSSLVNFSVCSLVIDIDDKSSNVSSSNNITTLWVSETCNLDSEKPFLPLVLQILEEIISRSPNSHESTTCPRSQLQKLKSEPISWIMDSHSSESFSSFFNLIFLTRLFWICACDASSEVGSLYFHSLLLSDPNIITNLETKHSPVLRTFFISVGTDVELCFMRTFGYMLAKCLILKEVTSSRRPAVAEAAGVGLKSISPPPSPSPSGFSYAMESHGLWILKGYAPVKGMKCVWTLSDGPQKISRTSGGGNFFPGIEEARETVVKYVLGHQQLEAVIQMEYTVGYYDGYIHVHARLDNIRLHVVKLGFKKNKEMEEYGLLDERYFASRVRVWVGPEIGANYLSGLSLGRSTENMEQEVEVDKTLKSEYSYYGGKSSSKTAPATKAVATARMATKTKMKNWRCDQDVEGNAAIFDAVLCDNTTGNEIFAGAGTWRLQPNGTAGGTTTVTNNSSNNRAFTKSGGVIFSCGSDGEWKDGVGWRLNKEMEGSVLKWRIGGQVWVTYWPNHVKTSFKETRFVEWCDEVELPLIPSR